MTVMPRRVIAMAIPFGAVDPAPLALFAAAKVELTINPLGRKPKLEEMRDLVAGYPVIIAGTEPYNAELLGALPGLKALCRVGIGFDAIDIVAAKRLGIAVTYTPDGPSPAVAELTVGLMIDLLRGVGSSDRALRRGEWSRTIGQRIATATVGIVGTGRIGRLVIGHLQGGFPGVRILANDAFPDPDLRDVEWVDKETLYRRSDVVSLHLPLGADTIDLVTARELAMMKPTAVLVNTARGGIVNEADLAHALSSGVIRAAALDVFGEEPYRGPLTRLPNILLTAHIGSLAADRRAAMEAEATQEALRILAGEPPLTPIPDAEYANAERFAQR